MIRTIEIEGLNCKIASSGNPGKIAYILYPMEIPEAWLEQTRHIYNIGVVAVSGMDWDNVFSPWPAPGVPRGCPDFKGNANGFLQVLTQKVVPSVESNLAPAGNLERTLVGVSMSGLFALWQWMVNDTFLNIASLSGSFWYEGFVEWMRRIPIPAKSGKAFFLLGSQESHSRVEAFKSVAIDTDEILHILERAGIGVEFQSVPGNHYSDPIPRLNRAFATLFGHRALIFT
ncbi:MAG: alpha/beta hydrolase-fold protein [Muribaculaceae bacterium]|nr:alpha/beta hydrolase-fold protein [Muribaculaceae bacterium]